MTRPRDQRTALRFKTDGTLWAVVEPWAARHGFRLRDDSESARLYQKGTGFLVAPMMCHIERQGNQVCLTAWIRTTRLVRLFGLFLIPVEMGVSSGGFKLAAPRAIARKAVNDLLLQLGQEPIG